MVRDEMSHDVALNYFRPPVNNALGMDSTFDSPMISLPNQIELRDHIISTQNIFIHSWGQYPTMIWPTCSNYT